MVLGMAFSELFNLFIDYILISSELRSVRNVYSLFNYGDFAQNSTDRDDPYVQLLSITNLTEGVCLERRPSLPLY